MYPQNPYEAVENKLQDIEQHQLNMVPVNDGSQMYNNPLQAMTSSELSPNAVHNGRSMFNNQPHPLASAPSVPQNIGQDELDTIPVRNEPPMNGGVTSVEPTQTMPKDQALKTNQIVCGSTSTNMICPHCNSNIFTLVKHRPSTQTHILAFLLSWICCCCLPYFVDSCRIADHNCPKCNAFLGSYSR